jgi:hypothetical protein
MPNLWSSRINASVCRPCVTRYLLLYYVIVGVTSSGKVICCRRVLSAELAIKDRYISLVFALINCRFQLQWHTFAWKNEEWILQIWSRSGMIWFGIRFWILIRYKTRPFLLKNLWNVYTFKCETGEMSSLITYIFRRLKSTSSIWGLRKIPVIGKNNWWIVKKRVFYWHVKGTVSRDGFGFWWLALTARNSLLAM